MSTSIDLPVLCASISLPKRLKSGGKKRRNLQHISEDADPQDLPISPFAIEGGAGGSIGFVDIPTQFKISSAARPRLDTLRAGHLVWGYLQNGVSD